MLRRTSTGGAVVNGACAASILSFAALEYAFAARSRWRSSAPSSRTFLFSLTTMRTRLRSSRGSLPDVLAHGGTPPNDMLGPRGSSFSKSRLLRHGAV